MKVGILAGGYGARLSEETDDKPKPMVEIGGHPILWHIMKLYSHYGFNDFIIALGGKGDVIKRLAPYMGDQTFFLYLGRRRVGRESSRASRLSSIARATRDRNRRSTAGSLRLPGPRIGCRAGVQREAADR